MRNKILAIIVLSLLVLTCVPFDGADSEHNKVRASFVELYHAVGVAMYDMDVSEGLYVYPVGGDESMKRYIEDPQNNTPDKGLSSVVKDTAYEVYFTTGAVGFKTTERTVVKEPYPLDPIVVREKCAVKLTMNSMQSNIEPIYTAMLNQMKDGEIIGQNYVYSGSVVTLNYAEDAYYVFSLNAYYSRSVYIDFDMDIVENEFTGSPYLYVGICVVSTVLVGLLIFLCGRRPDFG